jgi:hypothetical protein
MRFIVLVFVFGIINNNLLAQCSETENPTMKKYADLTRTGDAQACSQCAWLANLYCIAENGLYENDKSEVQNAIKSTIANIRHMGEPICCPELLTKSIKWGQPKKGKNAAGTSSSNTPNKTVADIQEVIQFGANQLDNVIEAKKNQKDIKSSSEIIYKNSTFSGSKYNSKEEIEIEYQNNLSNINNASDMFVKSQTRDSELAVERGKMSNDNFTAMASNLLGGLEVALAKSEAENDIANKKALLLLQKRYLLSQFDKIEAINVDKAIILNQEAINGVVNKGGNDYTVFNEYTLVEGWTPTIKYGKLKKYIKSDYKLSFVSLHMGLYGAFGLYEIKNSNIYVTKAQGESAMPGFTKGYISLSPYRSRRFNSDKESPITVVYYKKDDVVVQVVKTIMFDLQKFSTQNLFEYQKLILKSIQNKSDFFNIPAKYSNINIATIDPNLLNEFQIVVTVVWANNEEKAFTMVGEISVLDGYISLKISEGDLSLASPIVLKDLNDFIKYSSDTVLVSG